MSGLEGPPPPGRAHLGDSSRPRSQSLTVPPAGPFGTAAPLGGMAGDLQPRSSGLMRRSPSPSNSTASFNSRSSTSSVRSISPRPLLSASDLSSSDPLPDPPAGVLASLFSYIGSFLGAAPAPAPGPDDSDSESGDSSRGPARAGRPFRRPGRPSQADAHLFGPDPAGGAAPAGPAADASPLSTYLAPGPPSAGGSGPGPGGPELHTCIDCAGPSSVYCVVCKESFCNACFEVVHRSGRRRLHTWRQLLNGQLTMESINGMGVENLPDPGAAPSDRPGTPTGGRASFSQSSGAGSQPASGRPSLSPDGVPGGAAPAEPADLRNVEALARSVAASTGELRELMERAKFVPVRLNDEERDFLRLVESTFHVSNYADKADDPTRKVSRIKRSINAVCAILLSLAVSTDYKYAARLARDLDFKERAPYFEAAFEVARRFKIMNPDRMRTSYGTMMLLLQDSSLPEVADALDFSLVAPIKTVHSYLEAFGALALLEDPLLIYAIQVISPYSSLTRAEIDRDVALKRRAIADLSRKHANEEISPEEIELCILSLGDHNAFLTYSRDLVDMMITYLNTNFNPSAPLQDRFSLAIRAGENQARLSHSHTQQFHFVLQSLTLWREILHHMYQLWMMAEEDLLDMKVRPYRLQNTGQGVQRVQPAPRLYRAIQTIIHKVQSRLSHQWIGSSVVHLGDHNVPNALHFIDKYMQIPRILGPLVTTLRYVEFNCASNKPLEAFVVHNFGSVQDATRTILTDFFRHAFDGAGADNFFDAGSCVDGRLTSTWNWCSQIERKHYYPLFRLAGVYGFDGDFDG
ncbi:hypothetical protein H696_02677 [Fonticula alba]|uniref:Non-canonical E2 ubiquitin-conjugating enzyme C-terminal domain-containing protein n=1 Tax=Fonticula alba TaxID=691883 RepID=A0A058Z7U3_FONAL|nr:hypothetical protein H696_02677 [Fonticula alba]KCV70350.1 hypothetical protein H696_02677 [Fonticula alba]|eukprot:XP_009494866.1 hypothetical protein H696_02677 [Fonticula alba]